MAYRESQSLLFNEVLQGKHWEEDVGLLGPALQRNGSKCLVLIPHRKLALRRAMAQQHNISARLYIGKSLTLTTKLTSHKCPGQHVHRMLVPICSTDICSKIVSSWVETLALSPGCRLDTREIPVTMAAHTTAPHTVPRDAFAILKTFFTQEEIILAHISMCCLLLPKNRQDTKDTPDLFVKGSEKHK